MAQVDLTNKIDLAAIGAASGCYWSTPEMAMAGFGEITRIHVPTVGHLSQVAGTLAQQFGPDAIAFTALPFAPGRQGVLLVPTYCIVEQDGRQKIFHPEGQDISVGLTNEASPDASSNQAVVIESSNLDLDRWTKIVESALRAIAEKPLRKVVLARQLTAKANQVFDLAAVCKRLATINPTASIFSIDGFVGASPETLISKTGSAVTAHPLAGTEPRTGDIEVDDKSCARLLKSTKDQYEHKVTIDWFLNSLRPFCSFVDAEPEPTIVTLANLFHLGTRVDGQLSSQETTVAELVAALHPTPAVAGDPQQLALKLIRDLEPDRRGQYAGPVGWLDAHGDGEFVVGIRSCKIEGDTAKLWAGVGVVEGSDPEKEWRETEAKFATILKALGAGE